jgi:hypothetical protein
MLREISIQAVIPTDCDLLTVAQLCNWGGFMPARIYKEIHSGRLPARWVGKQLVMSCEDTKKWIAAYLPHTKTFNPFSRTETGQETLTLLSGQVFPPKPVQL